MLQTFAGPEAALLDEFVTEAAKAVELWLARGTVLAANRYSGKALVALNIPEEKEAE